MADDVFDLGQIRAFGAVARTGGVTAAAAALGLAQSTVSQHVQRFEARLGRPLLHRHARGVTLTNAGEAALVYARAMLALADGVARQFAEPPLDGALRLGVVEDFATAKLAAVLAVFRTQHPRFALTFETGLSTSLFRGLDEGELDVVVAKCLPGRLKGEFLWREELVWAGLPDMPGLEPGAVVPLATYRAPSETRDATLAALRDGGRRWSVVAQSTGLFGIVAAVQAGLGLAVFGRHLIPPGLAVLPDEVSLPSPGQLDYVVSRRAGPPDAAMDAFVALLREAALGVAGVG